MAYSNYRSDWNRDSQERGRSGPRDEREQRQFSHRDHDEEELRRSRESMRRDYYGNELGGRGRGGYGGRDQEDLGPRYGREFNRGYGQGDYDQYYGDYGQGGSMGGRSSQSAYGRGREHLGGEAGRHWGNEEGGWEGRENEQWRNRDVHGQYDRDANYGGFSSSGTGNYQGYGGSGGSYQGGRGRSQGGRSWGYQGSQGYTGGGSQFGEDQGGSYQGGQGRWGEAGTQYSASEYGGHEQGRYGQRGDYGYGGSERSRQGQGFGQGRNPSDYRPGQGGYGQGGFGQRGYSQGGHSQSSAGRPSGGRAYGEYSGTPSGYFGEDQRRGGQGRSEWGSQGQEQQSGLFRGRGPKGYKRSDDRIREEVCDCLTDDDELDASNIDVSVKDGEVTLSGFVTSREDKRRAEMLAERLSGVKEVQNSIRVQDQQRMQTGAQSGGQGGAQAGSQSGSQSGAQAGTSSSQSGTTTGRGDKGDKGKESNVQH
ncbi:BON domain-containing protein [Steroidobacter sp. S1-65]|uniref:BON domain-containing protein n=1 Tax=Steroidobacter gossypii TaxID=2805490 RepID=A0ABS1X6B1_9GAMM|nr:BON domain-containing protein [Steroidobacter gossypii]MBM0108767.1 BON domain-containing protein [Steroidobacter gossypii]